jgi:hypothetical protein
MRENDIRLFNYIAKIAARKGDTVIAPNTFEGVGPLESDDSIRQEEPTDYSWLTLLFPTLGLLLIPLFGKLAKLSRIELPEIPRSQLPREKTCAEKAFIKLLELIRDIPIAISRDQEAALLMEALRKLLDSLDDECKRQFLAVPETRDLIDALGRGAGVSDILEKLQDKTPEGLIAIAAIYLRLGAQNAAIRMYVLGNGGNEQLANWLAGLGLTVAAIIALGVALAAGSFVLDLTGFGLPAGIAVGTVSATIIALGIWLQQNQGNNNSGNSA